MQLICAFVFAYAKSRFSHDAAHIVLRLLTDCKTMQHIFLTQTLSHQTNPDILEFNIILTVSKNRLPEPQVIKLFSRSIQLSMKFILLINIKMPINDCFHD